MSCRGEEYLGSIDRDAPDLVQRQVGKQRGGSEAEPALDFLKGDIVARLRTSQI